MSKHPRITYKNNKDGALEQWIFKFQDKLPKLPIPPAEDTCERYLKALEAVQDEAEHARTEAAVEDFLKNDGPLIPHLTTWRNCAATSFAELTGLRTVSRPMALPESTSNTQALTATLSCGSLPTFSRRVLCFWRAPSTHPRRRYSTLSSPTRESLSRTGQREEAPTPPLDTTPKRLEWKLKAELRVGVRFAVTRISDLICQNDCQALEFKGYGKNFITSWQPQV
ncbi:hypothetical protein BDZ89DRAFT_283106 [Hymenopellis radicata]|nr:hypothetical protein BDZ89DRAFT_283106 [Hymenopellis radicata]